ncbi:MAG: CinA family nicotinamide mononucleotide deamidase-related protein [Pseudomonadales bacterium]|nr:CinA family nicotinamide mononucleotide deamidase-related protein [Gammaproteobacteria bacterium]NNL57097.1 CinA family nicotinamide mononucleotide deamidase-related protein [Pseudomonadales bacterium]
MQIGLLLTGNELMTGDTVDSNSAYIARKLAADGFDVAHKVTVGDQLDTLVAELAGLAGRYTVVIMNGGLGPTSDDLTAAALAKLCNVPLCEHPEARAHLEYWCSKRGVALNAANLKQAMLPQAAKVLANPVGSAVGFCIEHQGCIILATPGVPGELRAMLDGDVAQVLRNEFPDARARDIRRLKIFGIGESGLQQKIDNHFTDWPAQVKIGFRAGAPLLELKLEVEEQAALPQRDQCEQQLRELVGDYIVGENDDTLAAVVVELLARSGQRLALAESCTGGGMAAQITAVPGASRVFEAGIVSYSNAVKHKVLGVPTQLLEQHGAVSEPVALAMARGALELAGADKVIAVTGIAGPDGGTTDKPVGTVWIAWGERDDLRAQHFCYPLSRQLFQTMISALGLDLMRRMLQGVHAEPNYFRSRRK